MDAKLVMLESEHSMITAAGAAAATGVRVFTATSSQGLLYGMEMIYAVSGWRTPFVMVNVSRGIATPITLESDHNDILAARDSGFLQIHCATCQEVFDTILIAYKIAENPGVRLPVFVNMDGFYLSFTREPVELLAPEAADSYLGPFDPGHASFRASRPMSQATAVLGGGPYSYFRYQTHLGSLTALDVHEQAAEQFALISGRRYRAVEEYRNEDAEFSLVMIGSFATRAMDAIDVLRESGLRAGLVRPRLLRPFPAEDLKRALLGKKGCAVLDQNLSPGKGGVLHMEVCSALYGHSGAPVLTSFIGGLGGRDILPEEFTEIFAVTKRACESGHTPAPRLMYTAEELRELRKLQKIAHTERTGP